MARAKRHVQKSKLEKKGMQKKKLAGKGKAKKRKTSKKKVPKKKQVPVAATTTRRRSTRTAAKKRNEALVSVLKVEDALERRVAQLDKPCGNEISFDTVKVEDGDLQVLEEDYRKKHVWDIIDSYFEENRGLQSETFASFNRFVKESIPSIVELCGKVEVEDVHDNLNKTLHVIELTRVYLEEKVVLHSQDGRVYPFFPYEARSRNLTYSSPLSVDIRHTIKSKEPNGYTAVMKEIVHPKIPVGDIPIMVKSEFCRLNGMNEQELASYNEDPMDPGGYFIVNGKEKVLVTQEKPANNKLFLFKPMCDSKYQYECEIRSTVDSITDKVSALWIHIPGNPKSVQTFKDVRKGLKSSKSNPRQSNKGLNCDSFRRSALKRFMKSRPGLVVTIATVRDTVPLLILFKALGFETDKEIWDTFLVDEQDFDFHEVMQATMTNNEAKEIKGEEDALYYLGRRSYKEQAQRDVVIDHGRKLIQDEILPALGSEEFCNIIKGLHLGYMVNRLVYAYLQRIPCDDRDHLQNKRFDMAGTLLAALFKMQIKNLMNEARLSILRRLSKGLTYDAVKNIIKQKLMTRGIIYALTSGNWGDQRRGSTCRSGVSQVLNRLTGMATISYLRRINSPVSRLVRMTAPRQVHTTAFGYVCPADTPEGETVGLLKSLSVMAEVSATYDKGPIEECLMHLTYNSIEDYPEKLAMDTKILIDSEIIGTCPTEMVGDIVRGLKKCRREFDMKKEIERLLNRYKDPRHVSAYRGFSNQVSIVYDPEFREIRIRTDSGRAFRPLLVVKNNELVLRRKHLHRLLNPKDSYGWQELIQDGIIEFLDAAESETAMIAMFPDDLQRNARKTYITKNCTQPNAYKVTYTHCEIHPSMILGVCASLIPYPDHNQSPRNSYQSGMTKQAIGVYQTNFAYRTDTEAHVLHYPQRPLVTTKTSKFIQYDKNPAGINVIAAICCYSGYNQEDSVILCQSSVERGLFRSTLYRTKTEEERRNVGAGDTDEKFELPRRGQVAMFKNTNYAELDDDGFPEPGMTIRDNEPLIGKTQLLSEEARQKTSNHGRTGPTKMDISLMYRSSPVSLPSYIDSVMLVDGPDGYRLVKVKTRTPRIPQIGDKFASRHGQKGVVGMNFREEDMPFTKDGIVPDLILNPHAIPSRMTIGHLLETSAAKLSSLNGKLADGTCFTPRLSVDEMGKQLKDLGFNEHSLEVMYNGATGHKISTQVFIGPVFYQRLKHMTEDKMHLRCRGPITDLCRQPNAGLQRDGGLRFGEMERDSTISHGAAAFLRERLFLLSDYYAPPVCKRCGSILTIRPKNSENKICHLKCRSCGTTSAGAVTVEMPYACKLFFQELMSMNIRVQICPEEDLKDADISKKQPTVKLGEPSSDIVKYGSNSLLSRLIQKVDQLELENYSDSECE